MSGAGIDYSVEYSGSDKPVNRTQPLVSVRIITYNHKQFIGECVESVLMQKTDFPVEILIGEDDSTDGTKEIVKEYAEKYPDRIRLFLRSSQNKIVIDGIKTGRFNFIETIKSCRGKFIAMLDGDDSWTDPLKLQKQADFLQRNPDYVVCLHDATLVDGEGKTLRESVLKKELKRDITALELSKGSEIITSTICFRNVINSFPEEFYKVMNGDVFITSLLGKYGKGKYMPEIRPARYRLHGNSMYSSLSSAKALDFSINTRIQISHYYRRINEPELENHFNKEQEELIRIRRSWLNLGLFALRKHLYRFQLHFLGDRARLALHYFLHKRKGDKERKDPEGEHKEHDASR